MYNTSTLYTNLLRNLVSSSTTRFLKASQPFSATSGARADAMRLSTCKSAQLHAFCCPAATCSFGCSSLLGFGSSTSNPTLHVRVPSLLSIFIATSSSHEPSLLRDAFRVRVLSIWTSSEEISEKVALLLSPPSYSAVVQASSG